MKAGSRRRRVCAVCGAPIPEGKRADTLYCGRLCRDKAFYQANAAARVEAVSRYQKKHADTRRDYMREYMRRRRKGKK